MEVYKGKIYKHYKGNIYIVEDIAQHTETDEMLVIYRALYADCKLYARPMSMFVEVLDKYNQEKFGQVHRFELVEIPSNKK